MAKKNPTVKFSGSKPENNVLKASIPATATSHITGRKIGFNHRYFHNMETGLSVETPDGYKLCFSLVPELTNRGMVATNTPGNFTSGPVVIGLLNSGREIIEIKDGDPIATVWLEKIQDFDWSDE